MIVKEPDYPRVTSVTVEPGAKQGAYTIEAYLPGGAEELAFLVYDENLNLLGQAGVYKTRAKAINLINGTAKSMTPHPLSPENTICLPMHPPKGNQATY